MNIFGELKMTIAPNPTSDHAIISIQNWNVEFYTLELLDQYGRKISEQKLSSSQLKIERNNLAAGVYLLNVKSLNGHSVITEKLLFE